MTLATPSFKEGTFEQEKWLKEPEVAGALGQDFEIGRMCLETMGSEERKKS